MSDKTRCETCDMSGQALYKRLTTLAALCIMTCIGGCAQPDFTRTESAPQLPAYTGKVSVLKQFPYDGYVLIGTILYAVD